MEAKCVENGAAPTKILGLGWTHNSWQPGVGMGWEEVVSHDYVSSLDMPVV
jgi:hypothetical protein